VPWLTSFSGWSAEIFHPAVASVNSVVVLAITCGHETIITLSGLPWWHRVLGTAAALAFYGAHLIGQ
jgi:hypothetical protein